MSTQIVYRYAGSPIPIFEEKGILHEHIERLKALPPVRRLYQKREWVPGWVGGRIDVGPPGFGQPIGSFQWDAMPEIKPGVLYWASGATRPAVLVTVLPGTLLLNALNDPSPLFEISFLNEQLEEIDYFSIPLFPISWVRVGWVYSDYPVQPGTTTTTTTSEYEEPLPKEGRPEVIIGRGLYLTLLVSWTYFLREVLVSIRDTSSWAVICRQIFQAIARHRRLAAYLVANDIRSWDRLFIYREDRTDVPIPGWDTLPEYLETTTTTTTTTTTYECIPKGSTTTTTTTSTSTTTTTSDAHYPCETVPNPDIWRANDVPADCAIDAIAAHLCAIAQITDRVYFRKVARPAVMTGYRIAGAIQEGVAVRNLVVLAPECRSGVLPPRRYLADWLLPIARGDLHITITESTCSKDCLYGRLFAIHKALWRRLGRGANVASFVLTGTPFLPEQTDWLAIDLREGTATVRSAGAIHWPRFWAWDCPTTTTTQPGYNPKYDPEKAYPAPKERPPCTQCHCYWVCQETQDGYYWVRIDEQDECHSPCYCPEPLEVECDSASVGLEWAVLCQEEEEAPCLGNYAVWAWVQDGESYSEGHWELEEPCPETCDTCYPEFCCDDETITIDDGTTTTQDYECKRTYTPCFDPRKKEEEEPCPAPGSFPGGRDCTTTTTTTTPESCEGHCTWVWTDHGFVQADPDDPEAQTCPEGCHCCYPSDCEGLEIGDIAQGQCVADEEQCPEVSEECLPDDPLCGPWPPGHPCCDEPPTTTTTRDCDCQSGFCTWYLAPPAPGRLILVHNSCCPDCPCGHPTNIQLCEYAQTECQAIPPKPPAVPIRCRGFCSYVWCDWPDGTSGWVLVDQNCTPRPTALECQYRTWSGRIRAVPCTTCQCAGPPEHYPCVGSCVWECQNGTWTLVASCDDFGDDSGCQCPPVDLPLPCFNGNRISGRCEGENSRPICGAIGIVGCQCQCAEIDCSQSAES